MPLGIKCQGSCPCFFTGRIFRHLTGLPAASLHMVAGTDLKLPETSRPIETSRSKTRSDISFLGRINDYFWILRMYTCKSYYENTILLKKTKIKDRLNIELGCPTIPNSPSFVV